METYVLPPYLEADFYGGSCMCGGAIGPRPYAEFNPGDYCVRCAVNTIIAAIKGRDAVLTPDQARAEYETAYVNKLGVLPPAGGTWRAELYLQHILPDETWELLQADDSIYDDEIFIVLYASTPTTNHVFAIVNGWRVDSDTRPRRVPFANGRRQYHIKNVWKRRALTNGIPIGSYSYDAGIIEPFEFARIAELTESDTDITHPRKRQALMTYI